nr:histidine kinase [Microbacterium bovistercoris]
MVSGRRGWWARHWRDVVYDVSPPAILLALGLIDVFTGSLTTPIGAAPALTSLVPGTIACLALLFRRRYPLAVLSVILVMGLVPPLVIPTTLGYWDEFAVWLVALYSCARHRPLGWALVALAVSAVGMVMLPLEFAELRDAGSILFNSAMVAASFALGLLTRSWTSYRERSLRAAAERAVAEERAGRQERTRIARELHDVISHTITVIVMQAGGARLAASTDPTAAVTALARIEALGRESLTELRTLLEVLREEPDSPDGTAPQPTLADLDGLCAQMRGLGLPVRLRTEGETAALAPGIQLTGYRIVQEGLTNVLKHAGAVDTQVSVLATAGALTVEVECAPGGHGSSLGGTEHGLLGLRERVDAVGGTMSAGPHRDGGYLLRAELPVAERVS